MRVYLLIIALGVTSGYHSINHRHHAANRHAFQRDGTHTPAIVESFSSLDNLVCRSGAPRSFRVRDKVIFLHRSENGLIFTGRGEVKEVLDDGVMITVLNPKFGVGLNDQVYVVQRDTSPDSLSKLSPK
jgi:hypothetical protein